MRCVQKSPALGVGARSSSSTAGGGAVGWPPCPSTLPSHSPEAAPQTGPGGAHWRCRPQRGSTHKTAHLPQGVPPRPAVPSDPRSPPGARCPPVPPPPPAPSRARCRPHSPGSAHTAAPAAPRSRRPWCRRSWPCRCRCRCPRWRRRRLLPGRAGRARGTARGRDRPRSASTAGSARHRQPAPSTQRRARGCSAEGALPCSGVLSTRGLCPQVSQLGNGTRGQAGGGCGWRGVTGGYSSRWDTLLPLPTGTRGWHCHWSLLPRGFSPVGCGQRGREDCAEGTAGSQAPGSWPCLAGGQIWGGGEPPRHCGGSPEGPQSWQGAHPYRGAAQRPRTASPREGRWAPLFAAKPTGQRQLNPLQRGTRAELGTSNPWARCSGMAGWLPGPPSHCCHGLRGSRQGRARPAPQGTPRHLCGKNWARGKSEPWHCRAGAAGPGTG